MSNGRKRRLCDEPMEGEALSSSQSPDDGDILEPPENFAFKRPSLMRHSQGITIYPRPSIFTEIRQTLTDIGGPPLLKRFMGTVMGNFITIRRKQSANNALHYLLARELKSSDIIPEHERWFFVSGRIIRFTPEAFCLVTGLMFGQTNFDPSGEHEIPKKGLYSTHFKRPIRADELRNAFKSKDIGTDPEDYLKAANLLVYYFWLLCRDKPLVENWAWTLVEDPEKWELFPWGAYTYLNLIYYIKYTALASDQTEKRLYHFYGAVWALQIWSYEAISELGALCGKRDSEPTFPRCLMWETDHVKMDFSEFFDRRQLLLREVLEPLPHEEDERAWRSLTTRIPLEVRFEPPKRLGHVEVDEHVSNPPTSKKKQKKGKWKENEPVAKKMKVVEKSICRDNETAGSGHSDSRHARVVSESDPEIRLNRREDRPQTKRRTESSVPLESQHVCCLHGRPCQENAKKDGIVELIDRRLHAVLLDEGDEGFLRKLMNEIIGYFGPRVQIDHPVPQSPPQSGMRGPSHPQPLYKEPEPSRHSSAAHRSKHPEISAISCPRRSQTTPHPFEPIVQHVKTEFEDACRSKHPEISAISCPRRSQTPPHPFEPIVQPVKTEFEDARRSKHPEISAISCPRRLQSPPHPFEPIVQPVKTEFEDTLTP